ncbi:MAG TPA: energy transducer TonB [Myxococcales bacterium]|jgi:TonB family protein
MPLPQKPVRQSSRLTTAIAISVIAHVLLLPLLARDAMFHVQKKQGVTIISGRQFRDLVANQMRTAANGPITTSGQQVPASKKPPEPKKPEEEKPQQQKIDGQLVSLGTPEDERPPDKATKYLSEHDSRVEKETRAKQTSAFFKNALSKVQKEGRKDSAAAGAPALSEHPGAEGQGGGEQVKHKKQVAELPSKAQRDSLKVREAENGTLRNRDSTEEVRGTGKRIAMADPGRDGKESSQGAGNPSATPGMPGQQTPLKLKLDQPIGSAGPIEGGPMPDDLRGVEEGEGTFLNARSFKYASYLNRVKETVGRVWTQRVMDETSKRDPTGQLYSFKDRRTVVEFTIDKEGEIQDVKVQASSGVSYLDDVAVDAFRLVQRFPNPPAGLLTADGTVRLPFAFTLLAATGGMRVQMGPAYLPGSPAARGF